MTQVARWTLGVVFVFAGALKIAHPGDFHSDLLAYDVGFSDTFLRWVAIAFPWLELFGGGALIADVWRETTGPLIVVMCLVFIGMLGQAVIRGLDLRCGCFGTGGTGWLDRPVVALVRASLLLVLSLFVATRHASETQRNSR